MEAARPTPNRPLLLGRYTLLEKLGAGGHGEVWRAHDATLGIEVALKLLSPALARSETAWEALEHEHELAGSRQEAGGYPGGGDQTGGGSPIEQGQ